MFFLTKNLLIRAHNAFDELNYRPKNGAVSFDDFKKCMVSTLSKTKELDDAINVVKIYKYVSSHFAAICVKIKKYYDFWESMPYEGNELLTLEDDDGGLSIFVSNAFGNNYQNLKLCFSGDEDNELYDMFYSGGRLFIDTDLKECNYSIRYSKMSSTRMVLQDKSNNTLCIIVLSEDMNIFLENNKTDYDIVLYEGFMAVYKKQYIKSLAGEEPNIEESLAFLSWDIIDENSCLGVTKIDLFDTEVDFEIITLLAASCFLNFRKYIRSYRAHTFTSTIAISNILLRRR